jgi:hypothetical protein
MRSLIQRTPQQDVQTPILQLLPTLTALPVVASFVPGLLQAIVSAPPGVFVTPGIRRMYLWFSYTSGAAAGQMTIRVSFEHDGSAVQFREILIDPAITVAQPNGVQKFYDYERDGPIPGAGNTNSFVVPIDVPASASKVDIALDDLGAPKGTVQLSVTTDSSPH